MREKQDPFFLESNYGVDPDEVDMLTNNAWTATGSTRLTAGSDTGFVRLGNFILSTPSTAPEFLPGVSSQLDISNFTDYFVTQIHYQNGDWLTWDWFFIKANNTYIWREQEEGSLWRYGLWDLDFGLGGQGNVINDNFIEMTRTPLIPVEHNRIFDRLLDNPEYQNYFINRYADMLNTTFQPARMQDILMDMRDSIVAEMPRHFAQWGPPSTIVFLR